MSMEQVLRMTMVTLVYASSSGLFGPMNGLVNNIDFPAISGCILLESQFPYSLVERLKATGINYILYALHTFYVLPNMESICREEKLCPPDMPSLHEMSHNASLVITNSIRALEFPPRPTMPTVIYAGGAHVKPAKKLSKELEEWIAQSGKEGFIFFSLGSALNSSFLPETYRRILTRVFGSLKQQILWKWDEETMPDYPKNVKLAKWLPQQDILGHPQLRLFVTHGGLLSTHEATYHGVPLIGMPVYADQFSNMKSVENEGWGKIAHWKTLEEDSFRNLILEIINNQSFREIARSRSRLVKDVPILPDQEAAFWVEYIIRHKGAPHFTSPFRLLKWYEVYNMDAYAFMLGTIAGFAYFVFVLLKYVFRSCFSNRNASLRKKKRD